MADKKRTEYLRNRTVIIKYLTMVIKELKNCNNLKTFNINYVPKMKENFICFNHIGTWAGRKKIGYTISMTITVGDNEYKFGKKCEIVRFDIPEIIKLESGTQGIGDEYGGRDF